MTGNTYTAVRDLFGANTVPEPDGGPSRGVGYQHDLRRAAETALKEIFPEGGVRVMVFDALRYRAIVLPNSNMVTRDARIDMGGADLGEIPDAIRSCFDVLAIDVLPEHSEREYFSDTVRLPGSPDSLTNFVADKAKARRLFAESGTDEPSEITPSNIAGAQAAISEIAYRIGGELPPHGGRSLYGGRIGIRCYSEKDGKPYLCPLPLPDVSKFDLILAQNCLDALGDTARKVSRAYYVRDMMIRDKADAEAKLERLGAEFAALRLELLEKYEAPLSEMPGAAPREILRMLREGDGLAWMKSGSRRPNPERDALISQIEDFLGDDFDTIAMDLLSSDRKAGAMDVLDRCLGEIISRDDPRP